MRFNRESGGNGRSATSSDILLSTAQLGWRTTIGDGAAGNLVLLWEQDQPDPLHIDEGSITWVEDNYDFTAGFFFPPFGTFNSRFIVHPITQDLGETQQGAVKFHYAASKTFDSSITIADGKARKERTRSDKANDYCLRLDATPDIGKNKSASIGIQYYSNFANTNADLLGIASATDTFVLRRMAGGAGINLELAGGPFGLTGEYIGATKRFDPANLDANGDGGGDRPKAWNLELYYNRSVKNVLSFKYEGSGEFAGSPKSRYGINSNWNAGEGLTFSFEFLTASYSAGFAPAKAYGNTRRSNSVYSKFSLEF
ncbi:MAG: LbtU family siderophore porin [bacterium]